MADRVSGMGLRAALRQLARPLGCRRAAPAWSALSTACFVDDWVDSGGQALGVQRLVERTGASWVGSAVIVDALTDHRVRRQLAVRALLHVRDL